LFGYVSVYKPELKVREFETFRAYYCGLCKELARSYPGVARLGLTYECTLLYMLLAAQTEEKPEFRATRCPVHPLEKRAYAVDTGREYAAAMNVLLTAYKLEDAWQDEKNLGAGAGRLLFSHDMKKAAALYPKAARGVKESLLALSALEQAGEQDYSRVSGAFGDVLRSVFGGAEPSPVMENMGYNLGRWIYLADALEDLEEDRKKHRYNPFLGAADLTALREEVDFDMRCCITAARAAFDLLPIYRYRPIFENIFDWGLPERTRLILEGKKAPKNKAHKGD